MTCLFPTVDRVRVTFSRVNCAIAGLLRVRHAPFFGDAVGVADPVSAGFGPVAVSRKDWRNKGWGKRKTPGKPGVSSRIDFISAERAGFEPAVGFYPHAALAKRCFRPLSHLSLPEPGLAFTPAGSGFAATSLRRSCPRAILPHRGSPASRTSPTPTSPVPDATRRWSKKIRGKMH